MVRGVRTLDPQAGQGESRRPDPEKVDEPRDEQPPARVLNLWQNARRASLCVGRASTPRRSGQHADAATNPAQNPLSGPG